jgi:hypothetical protein
MKVCPMKDERREQAIYNNSIGCDKLCCAYGKAD